MAKMKIKTDRSIVMMAGPERNLIEKELSPETIMVEWGSGGSTLYFSTFVKQLCSFEHNPKWYQDIKDNIENQGVHNVEYHYAPSDHWFTKPPGHRQEGYRGTPIKYFETYVNAIERYERGTFDVALIDGRCRMYCAVKLLPYLKDNGFLYIHDFWNRRQYHEVFKFYDEVESKKRKDGCPQTIIKLKKKDKKDMPDPSFYDCVKTTEEITEILKRDPNNFEWIGGLKKKSKKKKKKK